MGLRRLAKRLVWSLRPAAHESARDPQALFTEFYRRNKWRGLSRSGTGSDAAQTGVLERQLGVLLRELGVRHLLDVPCGDFAWMQRVDLTGIDYLGGDIVPPLIDANRRRYGRAGVEFRVIDLLRHSLPAADLLLCRDCLVHLPLADGMAALRAVAASDIDYLLLTTFPGRPVNADIQAGKWRPLDLQRAPFVLPPPLRLVVEQCTEKDGRYADKALGLWRRVDLVAALAGSGDT